jgi:predicted DCC family thiol-disulfide oxidoreductase YuxK
MTHPHRVEVYFDGACPLCKREVDFVRRRDRHSRVLFTDIAAEGFDPTQTGLGYDELMAEIRGRLPDGQPISGVEVFRQMYAAIGLSPVVALTRLPGVSHLLDLAYRVFARNRLRLTGRCDSTACPVHAPH